MIRPPASVFLLVLALNALPAPCSLAGEDAAGAARAAAEAKRLFDRGDLAGAEREVSAAIALLPESARADRAVRLAQRAEARILQGISGGALADIDLALSLDDSVAVRRSAVFVCLRARRYRQVLPHAEALIAREPAAASHRFSRGIALAKEGRFREALADLARGLEIPEARREARFEMALALADLGRPGEALIHLREILEDDPFDAEAVYQASRQALKLGAAGSAGLAGLLGRYFEALREEEGPASRDQHLLLAGKPLEAARERAARWERLGRYDRALAEAETMRRLAPGGGEAEAWLEAFWTRHDFTAVPSPAEVASALDQRPAGSDGARVTRLARLLVALDPRSAKGLEALAGAASDPALLVPRLHYASRLAALGAGNRAWVEERDRLRLLLQGGARAATPVR